MLSSSAHKTVNRARRQWLLLGLGLGSSMGVLAQTSVDVEALQRANQRAIQEAQERSQPQADVFTSPGAPLPAPSVDSVTSNNQPCLPVRTVALVGHLQEMGAEPSLPTVGSCVGESSINALLSSLNAHYQAAGWITTRVYVDPAGSEGGDLRLQVVPGRIESIVLGGGETDTRIGSAFPLREERLLNLRDLEQGLENINRLPSQEGAFTLVPGAQSGSSRVHIDLKEKSRVRLSEMVDNSGTKATGQWKSTTELAIDNPTHHNDQLAVGLIANLDRGDLRARFKGLTFNYLVPKGYHVWSLSGSAIRTTFELPGINASYPLHTRADKLGLGYEYLFFRDQTSKHALTAGLDVTRQNTRIADIEITSQERRLTVFNVGYKAKLFVGRQSHEWVVRLEQGLKSFNAQTTLPDGSHPQYRLIKLRLNSNWPLPNNQGLLRTLLQAQAGSNKTPSLAQISVGGRYDVRGYQQNSLYAATGAFLRTEYETPAFNTADVRWNAFAGLDAGHVKSLPSRPLSQQHLVGGALGIRGEVGQWRVELSRARALSRPDEFANDTRDHWYAQLSFVY